MKMGLKQEEIQWEPIFKIVIQLKLLINLILIADIMCYVQVKNLNLFIKNYVKFKKKS